MVFEDIGSVWGDGAGAGPSGAGDRARAGRVQGKASFLVKTLALGSWGVPRGYFWLCTHPPEVLEWLYEMPGTESGATTCKVSALLTISSLQPKTLVF